tara:strand:+ start:473 stop:904 length:432 start_codon:yes stop_codon:yes gene_type:complete
MKKYKNWGIDMGGLSMTDPERYRKINYVLNDKGVHTDLLDVVETAPLEYVYDLADKGPSPEDGVIDSDLKTAVRNALLSLTPREERIIRKRFGIGLKTDHTLEEVGQEFSVTRGRIRDIEAKALRKMKHPFIAKKLVGFLNAA